MHPTMNHCDCPIEDIKIWVQPHNKFSYKSNIAPSTIIKKEHFANFGT